METPQKVEVFHLIQQHTHTLNSLFHAWSKGGEKTDEKIVPLKRVFFSYMSSIKKNFFPSFLFFFALLQLN